MKPILGITMGDAAGIGPELILKALATHGVDRSCRPLVIGSLAAMEFYRDRLRIPVRFRSVPSAAAARFEPCAVDVLDLGIVDVPRLKIGVVDANPGEAAVVCTQEAGRMALRGDIDAIVSAPLNKEAMRAAGYRFEGQTEILGELAGSKRYGMILLLGNLRVMMLTTHCALQDACRAVTKERVLGMLMLADQSLRTFGVDSPRIAVAGLNPHAGERGLFGREEVEGSIPAIEAARASGINALGPIPADVVFLKARDGEFDLVLAMYHDQANMAGKLLGFGEVVTVIAGIPFIRTSVGHGTAFDIAGKGVADEKNFVLAIEKAAELASLKKGQAR